MTNPSALGPRVGISAIKGRDDLTDIAAHLDEIEAMGVDTIELPLYDWDVVLAGKPFEPNLKRVEAAVRGRKVGFSAHGPLSINFFDEPFRCPTHFAVLKANLEVTARLGAVNYVLHAGHRPTGGAEARRDAKARQREWLAKAGDLAKTFGIVICVENIFDWTWGKSESVSPVELAAELAAVNHPNIAATIDFGHAQLEMGLRGGETVSELKAMAPLARHLHVHDGFGLPDDIYMYNDGERFAYGYGDLHLPVGHGATPWDAILAECTFPRDVLFNVELNERHWFFAAESVARTREMAARARLANE